MAQQNIPKIPICWFGMTPLFHLRSGLCHPRKIHSLKKHEKATHWTTTGPTKNYQGLFSQLFFIKCFICVYLCPWVHWLTKHNLQNLTVIIYIAVQRCSPWKFLIWTHTWRTVMYKYFFASCSRLKDESEYFRFTCCSHLTPVDFYLESDLPADIPWPDMSPTTGLCEQKKPISYVIQLMHVFN